MPGRSLVSTASAARPVQSCSSGLPYTLRACPSRRAAAAALTRHGTRAYAGGAGAADKKVLVPVGQGTEEMEAVIIIDVLRRAGAQVVVASVESSREVVCSRGVKLVADCLIGDCGQGGFDLIACPGGMPGAERLRDSTLLTELVTRQQQEGRYYAAICATPAVFFGAKGLLAGKKATAHPAFETKLPDTTEVAKRVVVDGKLTTSKGPGTAFEFALSLVKQLYGEAKMKEVAGPMVMYDYSL